MKRKALAAILLSTLVISACSSNEDATSGPKQLKAGDSIDHLHGLTYSNNGTLYIGTHEGMISSKDQGKTWDAVSSYDFDFMGFHTLSNGDMITSGHPGPKTDLPNPLGVMKSTDHGEKWDSVSLLGKIDFHIMTSDYDNPNIIYGLNQMGEGEYGAGIYKSTDGGKNWDKIEPKGLPEDLHKVYTLVALPDKENTLLAGTENGVLHSDDGGKTWTMHDSERLITAFSVIPNETKDLISYSITKDDAAIMISKDDGMTWEKLGLNLGKDAVNYISVNPENLKQLTVSSFNNSVFVSEDGGQNWNEVIKAGEING
ncbi:F510_1955 family glycosylhydrolase [Schinkia sp. CFF1]